MTDFTTTQHAPPARHPEPAPARARAPRRAWLALAVLMLPTLLVSVDNTVLSFALPAISRDLAPTAAQQLWIIDAYPLVLAGLLVAMGSAGDRYGRRRMLLIGSIGFTVLSVAAAFAPTAEALIAARAALGFFGAMLMPSTLSLLRTVFTDREQRRLAIAIWASGFAAGAALGPIVGGVLLEHFHWGSVFLLAVPVLVPMLILVPLLIPESRDPSPGRIDLVSTLLSLAAMGPVVYGIKSLATEGFTAVGAAPDRARRGRRRVVRAPPAAQQLADARYAAVPPGLVRRRGAHQPVQRHRARRLPLLRVAAPAAHRRTHARRGGHGAAARARRDDRRGVGGRADRPARAAPGARARRARALGRRAMRSSRSPRTPTRSRRSSSRSSCSASASARPRPSRTSSSSRARRRRRRAPRQRSPRRPTNSAPCSEPPRSGSILAAHYRAAIELPAALTARPGGNGSRDARRRRHRGRAAARIDRRPSSRHPPLSPSTRASS